MEIAATNYKNILFPQGQPANGLNLSDLQHAMLNATLDCVKVISTDGKLLTMNRAGCRALGIAQDSAFGMSWLPLLTKEVQELGIEALGKASRGENARFPGQSGALDDIRHWDNLLTPVKDDAGRVFSIVCISRDVTEQIELKRRLEDAISREQILSAEMRHRIKNVFSVVSGLISISDREAAVEDEPVPATKILRAKLAALGRASDAAFAALDSNDLDRGVVDLGSLVRCVLEPYGVQCRYRGDTQTVGQNNMTTLALFLHELATNSVKYGALSVGEGEVVVDWKVREGLRLSWIERGGPEISVAPVHEGFGTEMVDRIVHSTGGTVRKSWLRDGLVAELHLPVTRTPSC